MQKWAERLYKSKTWQKVRNDYAKSVGGLCEQCRNKGLIRAGVIVHHKVHLTPQNVDDPSITLNFDNLELLCRDCHASMHKGLKRYTIDEYGRVIPRGD